MVFILLSMLSSDIARRFREEFFDVIRRPAAVPGQLDECRAVVAVVLTQDALPYVLRASVGAVDDALPATARHRVG